MKFPDLVNVTLVVRKIGEETTDDATWVTYALEGAPGLQIDFRIDAGSFDDPGLKDLEAALAEELAEAIVRTVQAQASGSALN